MARREHVVGRSVDSALTARHLATGVGKAGAVDTSAGGGVLIAAVC